MPAPIALFVYNRPIHTRRTVEALQRNVFASESDLFIYSDAPKNSSVIAAVCEVRSYIKTITGFNSVCIVERDKNWGLAGSVIDGVTTIVNRYGRVIVLEDDLVTSPRFLDYLNTALQHYERDPKAFSIGAYNFPEKTLPIPSDYQWDTYASFRCCSWGWATWIDRWKRIDWDMAYYDTFMRDSTARELFNRGGPDMSGMLKMQYEKRIDSWAIRFCYAHHANNMHCIYPVKTLVMNIGLDDSGMHCGVNPRWEHTSFDEQWIPHAFCPGDNIDMRISHRFYDVFVPPKRLLVRRILQRLGL
ncbi:MAG: hypothetical protein QM706_18395 [Nitrospira sp.]